MGQQEDKDFDREILAEHRAALMREQSMQADSIEVSNSFGKLRANGPLTIIILIITLATAGLAWAVRDHDIRSMQRNEATDKRVEAIGVKMEEVVYVLTLDETQRKALRLDVPEGLRKRSRDREQ